MVRSSMQYTQGEGDSPLLGDATNDGDISYFNGQQVPNQYINYNNET
jgi:hypothetical protein